MPASAGKTLNGHTAARSLRRRRLDVPLSPDEDDRAEALEPAHKKPKPEPLDEHLDPETNEDKLVDLLCDFSLTVNELFQLKEYGSLVDWNPADFSRVAKPELPEIYEYFVNKNDYKLQWHEFNEDMSSLPLRLQKKKLQELDEKLRDKYPYMDDVLLRASQKELGLLSLYQPKKKPQPAKSKPKPRPKPPSESPLPESELEISELEDYSDLDTNYKLKSVHFAIPRPIVTHPSHIPDWRPTEITNAQDSSEGKIIPYDVDDLKVVSDRADSLKVPEIEARIKTFLASKYKAGIIDDGGVEVANTPEEYDATLSLQLNLFKRLYEKILVEERFEVNGDKIERRKVLLPNVTTKSSDFFRENGCILPKIQGAANDLTYQDHFVAQGMAFSRVHQSMRRQHQARTRRIVQMIQQHFRKKAGESERIAREREQNLRRISRLATQAVKKRWSQANKVYRHIQHEKEEELKQIEGREHLSKMLEHSTQLLEAQLNRSSREGTEAESGEESGTSDSDDEDSFSSSSESDDDTSQKLNGNGETLDSELSVAELREKYANLDALTPKANGSAKVKDSNGLAALVGNGDSHSIAKSSPLEYDKDQMKLIESLSGAEHSKMLDSDEFSDSMDEESLSSEDEESATSETESSEAESISGSSLTNLYSNEPDKHDASDGVEAEEESQAEEKTEEINGLKVRDVPIPSLLRGTLRPYQKQGLNWLASLYNNDTNGILADEMGLGKTIQTISLLAYLACEHHIWGPHLIIVPTSVMLNWEMEFKKFAPGFKVLTYYGSPQERARKRKGWNKEDAFHVCITSYQLVVHDHSSFKRKRWRYMILDEAHNIKNFRSNRWKALLNFNTENRLLLTGTPLQNNLMELWSLLYFLMPSSKVEQMMPEGFANFDDFQQWFGKPVDKILEKTATGDVIDEDVTSKLDQETKNTVSRLHQVLRPYLLRRLKKDVEKQMPGKYEHIVYCRLSNRQRYLYDDFMSRAKTKETLASGNFLSIINCLMQLRKVCNHPDLFEVRPIVTSFAMPRAVVNSYHSSESAVNKLIGELGVPLLVFSNLNLDITAMDDMNYFAAESAVRLMSNDKLQAELNNLDEIISKAGDESKLIDSSAIIVEINRRLKLEQQKELRERYKQAVYLNTLRCLRKPLLGASVLDFIARATQKKNQSQLIDDMILGIPERESAMHDVIEKYAVITPPAVAIDMKDQMIPIQTQRKISQGVQEETIDNPFHQAQVKLSIAFPDKLLLQYDCGKLQKLASLLQELVPQGHRALIFTQMTKVLDILEQFLNIHGYRYMRLDGATKIEDRQLLTEKFNRDPKIPVFILSTRSGGLGINLTGADTVIFYDSDWNPAMDKQCQDRCHRIGQLRDVHIYRFVSEYTIESNILKKANQKRQLDNVVIQEGDFTTDYLGKFSVRDLVNDTSIISDLPDKPIGEGASMDLLAQAEDEADRNAAKVALREVAVDDEDFEDSKQGTPAVDQNSGDMDYDEGVGHIDEYMLRFIAEGLYVE